MREGGREGGREEIGVHGIEERREKWKSERGMKGEKESEI